MIKKILLIVAGLALLGGLVAALVIFQPWGLIGWDRTPGMGNTPGNIVNGGMVAQSGDWHYYRKNGWQPSIFKMTNDGNERQLFYVDTKYLPASSNILGDWIYFEKGTKGITKMKLDGTGQKDICTNAVGFFSVIDGWVYYANEDDNSSFYRIRTNGTGCEKLIASSVSNFNVANGWIYYTDGDTYEGIYKVSIDGSGQTQIVSDTVGFIVVDDEWVYYCNRSDGRNLYKVKTDGTEKAKIYEDEVAAFNVSEGWIYYCSLTEDRSLYKMRTDGTERQLLTENSCRTVFVLGDWVYYEAKEGSDFCRVRTDGTGWENLNTEP